MPRSQAAPQRGAPWPARLRALTTPALLFVALVAVPATSGGVVGARTVDDAVPDPVERESDPTPSRRASGTGNPDDKRRAKEALLKAAFLFNFLKYAEFPEEAFDDDEEEETKAPLVVLIVGDDPFESALEKTFRGKELRGRALVVRRSKEVPDPLDAHLIFTAGLSDEDEAELIEATREKPCILVGDDPGFAERGGFINFYMSKRKPRFEVNVGRQEDTGVELSANLLKLAKVVEEKKPDEKKKGGSVGGREEAAPAPERIERGVDHR